ncbi:MAG: DUF2742 domain-containing protein [Mycobacterium sp.]|nr:DUF2742 domain-containing protein [Mycobacterium sp.]
MTDNNDYETEARHDTIVAGSPASKQVSWWPTHEFIAALVANANNLPIAGTPAWQALSDNDPAKPIALAVAGEHHVLRIEVAQTALAEASKAVASVPDWRTRPRGASYIERRRSA